MSMNEATTDGLVTINVGGKEFRTFLSTLKKSDTISKFIGGQPIRNMVTLKDGTIFIDRDAKHFQLILNFLRDITYYRRERMASIPTGENEVSELKVEAMFYGIRELVSYCEYPLCNRRYSGIYMSSLSSKPSGGGDKTAKKDDKKKGEKDGK